MSNCCSSRDLPIAVITGVHPFDVPGFHRLFRALPGIDAYLQDVENFALDWGRCRADYGAAVFYNMHPGAPPKGAVEDALLSMGETGQGRVLLTTEHQPSMRALAWTRQHMNSRVFCLQLGHDAKAWQDANFQQVLSRGILWASGRL